MDETILNGANVVAMFCRQNINTKKELPLRSSEIGLLIYTVKNEYPVTPLMAADFFKVSKPMIAGMVKSLTSKEYLTKEQSQTDRRSFALVPTDKAIALTNSVYDEYFKVINRLLSGMGKEKYKSMIALLEEANAVLLEGDK
ncbi:MarR family transcriptional regulator [Peptostreptococcaceae bacterium OttesenSCG-928-C18]|nr:MarR family transcriptional regulator [Peptostreptococcaceae bacterium OttesenSCG-928-C18]